MIFRILPYKLSSESAKLLSEGLEGLRIHPERTTYRRSSHHTLINWGTSNTHYEPKFLEGDFNHPRSVAFAADKRVAYQLFRANLVPTVEWTENLPEAEQWLQGGNYVYGRDTASGHSGQGMTFYKPGDTIARHLFYTKYAQNKHEYRIHVGRTKIIDITQKRRRNGHVANANVWIRNFDNGWVFCRNAIEQPPNDLLSVAVDAVRALDLDFGAVDVCVDTRGRSTVFEVNTAPGIEGTTLNKYVEFFKNEANSAH